MKKTFYLLALLIYSYSLNATNVLLSEDESLIVNAIIADNFHKKNAIAAFELIHYESKKEYQNGVDSINQNRSKESKKRGKLYKSFALQKFNAIKSSYYDYTEEPKLSRLDIPQHSENNKKYIEVALHTLLMNDLFMKKLVTRVMGNDSQKPLFLDKLSENNILEAISVYDWSNQKSEEIVALLENDLRLLILKALK